MREDALVGRLEALAEAGATPASEPRTVTVKGISTPVTVATIDWDASR